jgi:hypothetical protein
MSVRFGLKRRDRVKKSIMKDKEQKRNPRRLGLSRETIRLLDEPALLKLAVGGSAKPGGCALTTSTAGC